VIGGRRRLAPRIRVITQALTRMLGGLRPRRRDRSGVDEPQIWRPGRLISALTLLTRFAALAFLVWLGWSVFVIVHGGPSAFPYDPDRRCTSLGFTCGAVSNVLTSVLLLAVASSFVLWRLFRLLRWYRVRARTGSRELAPTAGTILHEVVGRDELCKVLMADLHERWTRPHVLVGGVGAGKTAVLVRLSELLADRRAVPVPVRLRDATKVLDFESLARKRFLSEVDQRLISSAEGEIIWRRLRKEGRIVVLADGLEEAVVGTGVEQERDNVIRAAIRQAHQQRLPLVIASRPHDPLQATEAAILALEPLSYEAALAYIGGGGTSEDEQRLAWIVEAADVAEAPLYLQIIRELRVRGLLDHLSGGQQQVADTRDVDRSQLRLALLETWRRALISGHLCEDVPLHEAERIAAVEHLSALACVGLKCDKREVEFSELQPEGSIVAAVQARLAEIDGDARHTTGIRNIDVPLAAAWAAQLELVELRGNSVRFPHSLIQAYLGSRLLDVALQDPAYCEQALKLPGPGREFLIAMVLRSRAADGAGTWQPDSAGQQAAVSVRHASAPAVRAGRPPSKRTPVDVQLRYVAPLRQAATRRDDNKALDMYTAALEIDCGAPEPTHLAIADEIKDLWPRIHAQDPRTVEEGKLALVRRFGEAARRIDDRRQQGETSLDPPAYKQLYEIAAIERSYPVRLAAAQEVGIGGDGAYKELREVLVAPSEVCKKQRAARSEQASRLPGSSADSSPANIISAWLAPMLVGSMGASGNGQSRDLARQAQADLDRWLRHIRRYGRRSGEEDLEITLEIAVAQGFKYAANRRPAHVGARHEARTHLAERALEMLKGTGYWFSQLTLIQALCLLSLSDQPKKPAGQPGAKPEAIVQHWIDVAGRESADRNQPASVPSEPHPFVRAAAQLALLALRTGKPERYLWIDESGVVGQVGSRQTSGETTYLKHRLWISPSAGWAALDGRAQQLVADVLLLLNLADRGDQPPDSERRLKRSNRYDLPPCITGYRPALDVGLTVGSATSAAPGTSCVDGCAFELCPYPPRGAQPGVEMSEAFCRRQQTLLTRRSLNRRKAPWQEMRRGQLVQFWAEMADRARGPRPRSAARTGNATGLVGHRMSDAEYLRRLKPGRSGVWRTVGAVTIGVAAAGSGVATALASAAPWLGLVVSLGVLAIGGVSLEGAAAVSERRSRHHRWAYDADARGAWEEATGPGGEGRRSGDAAEDGRAGGGNGAPRSRGEAEGPEERFFRAELEDHPTGQPLKKDDQYTIAFSVGPSSASATAQSRFPDETLAAARNDIAVFDLTVQLDSGDFEIFGDSARPLRVPRIGRSLGKARFEIAPRRNGRCHLVASVHYKGNFVHQMELTFLVGGRRQAPVEVSTRGRPVDSVAALEPRNITILLEPAPGDGFVCTRLGSDGGRTILPIPATELAAAAEQARTAMMSVISSRVAGEKVFQTRIDIPDDAQDAALRTLARAGSRLFQRLFLHPAAGADARSMGEWLRGYAMDPGLRLKVQIFAYRAPLPWAMLYLGDASEDAELDWSSFLGMRHIVEQLPLQRSLGTRDNRIPSRPNLAVSVNVNLSIDDPSRGLTPVAGHQRYWSDMAAARAGLKLVPRSTKSEVVRALASRETSDQIVYFCCHAKASAQNNQDPDTAEIIMGMNDKATLADLNIDAPTTVQLPGNPLVFINACESADLSPLFYNGFVPYFMDKGARGVIGTECKTPILFAIEWANAFFEQFLDGGRVGETVLKLRQDFLREHGNPLGLIYAVHCDADTRITPALARAGQGKRNNLGGFGLR
jgi:hypothetical protein